MPTIELFLGIPPNGGNMLLTPSGYGLPRLWILGNLMYPLLVPDSSNKYLLRLIMPDMLLAAWLFK